MRIKIFLLFALLLCSACSQSLRTGGHIPTISRVSAIGSILIDFSQPLKSEIASFTIDNNAQSFILSLKFLNNGKFYNSENKTFITPEFLVITASGTGVLGTGITPLKYYNLLPLTQGEFLWIPENQTTATINYGLKILASWPINRPSSGIYIETITATINSSF